MIILAAGDFGAAVAARMAATHRARAFSLIEHAPGLRSIIGAAEFVAVAAWRPYPTLFQTIDELCFELRVRWSSATIHGQRLVCGPLVDPGKGPCYHCYRKRELSHQRAPDWELVLESWYERDPNLGPPGFAQPLVEIAAGALTSDAAGAEPGRLRCVDVLTGAVLETQVIGVHGCPRCRPLNGGERDQRFVRDLIPAIEDVLK